MANLNISAALDNTPKSTGISQNQQDRISRQKIQSLLEQTQQTEAQDNQQKHANDQNFLSVLTKKTDAAQVQESVLNTFAKQTDQKAKDRDQNVQISANGFMTEKPKLI